ncbi:MAG: SPOR domain-containing protein [Flavobacteriales bacterium]|nr:SPOR domain-containing protein [Flavobacteriales bacterium]
MKFHLAAGSFTVEQNARTLHEKLKSEGYDAVYLGRIGDYYKVSYQSFKNEADAKAALQSLKDKGVSSWMMKHEL